MDRRTLLRRTGVVLAAGVAGCSEGDNGGNGNGDGGNGDGNGGSGNGGGDRPCTQSAAQLATENVQRVEEDGELSFTGDLVNNFDEVVRLASVWTETADGQRVSAISSSRVRLLLPGERRTFATQGFEPADGTQYQLRPTRYPHCTEFSDGIRLTDHGLDDRGEIVGTLTNENDESLRRLDLFARITDADGNLSLVLRAQQTDGLEAGGSWDFTFNRYTVDDDQGYELDADWVRIVHDKYYE